MDSAELAHIRSCQAGNLADFDPLYTLHVEAIYTFLYRRTLDRSTAEDLTSTVFLKAMESIRSFDPARAPLRAWLYRIARNQLIDYYRSASRTHVDIESIWDLASDEIATLGAERAVNAAELHKALQKLKPMQRNIVMLRIWEDLSYKEIAEILGTSEGNAKVIFSRTLSELRTSLPSLLLLLLFPHTL
ncbi:hypothetical protein A2881_04320 [Candidatus Peribacteria bacterium RIFCSPHIGHO2_01_FULL_55_13]|nr:MAG: hypothetical protein A2881_04320 [Candidatus Peribacteria bacterium RIFCSPHIGHO2_01_FULL_55_13]OGJ65047.1 MAG: hypothetical protein A3F36_01180 [Candidatus Peribacteria bacterium RIFCSPHIGHO2_12_FULL_55_11]